jgi:hypothetical protein
VEVKYKILVRNGITSKIGTSVYEDELRQHSMDESVLEALANTIDDKDKKQYVILTVDIPTVISEFQEIPCPNPNLRDRCQLVTAEITLIGTDDTRPEFDRGALEVAVAIAILVRLRFT